MITEQSNRVRDAVRVGLTGAGSVIGVLLTDSAWGALPGALLGLFAAFVGEWALHHRAEFRRLQEVERTVEQHVAARQLAERQAELARREMAVSEAWTEIWGGAFNEAARGQVLPLSAILARAEVTLKARGLDPPPAGRFGAARSPSALLGGSNETP